MGSVVSFENEGSLRCKCGHIQGSHTTPDTEGCEVCECQGFRCDHTRCGRRPRADCEHPNKLHTGSVYDGPGGCKTWLYYTCPDCKRSWREEEKKPRSRAQHTTTGPTGTAGEDPPLPEREECSGICLTPADIGLPEYGGPGVVAYPHPDCPQHGEPPEEPPLTPEEEERIAAKFRDADTEQAPDDLDWNSSEDAAYDRPPQPERRPPLLVSYSVQGHVYDVALSGDAIVSAVDGALVIKHRLGFVAGITGVAPLNNEES